MGLDSKAQTKWKTFTHPNGFTINLPGYFKQGLYVAELQYYDNSIDSSIVVSVETYGRGTETELKNSYNSSLQSNQGVSYPVFRPGWYVISGQESQGIYYVKAIIKNGLLFRLDITYPVSEKQLLDQTIPGISTSFK